jgi:hypothetical protein
MVNKKKRREALFREQDGKCYWCDRQMLMPKVYPTPDGSNLPVDLCTLDHLFDRRHPLRSTAARGEKRYVAACWQCNHDRGFVSMSLAQWLDAQPASICRED